MDETNIQIRFFLFPCKQQLKDKPPNFSRMQMEKMCACKEWDARRSGLVPRLVRWCREVAGATCILWKPMAPNSLTIYIYTEIFIQI
jgi:hypothetical protein